MHLKRLSLSGFKSFADRTRLEFEPAVNVVVGPNGAGKSNLVDAVSWVMGTQATTTLRTDKMADVIFSGTATRPALNRAEVSLTFDNTEGMLPLDLSEVTVTRRLFRDGTSEYEINGTSCRLLDIQELLNDSNVGRHQHVIVAQGRVGAILAAKPEEHRAVIEEAAGVVKHRSRRDRSIKRLEQTGEDVKRLQDILREQHRLMKPLRRQAEAADRYDAVKAEARALRLYLGGEELRTLRNRIDQAETDRKRYSQIQESAGAELAEVNSGLARLEAAAGESGTALERDTAAAARLETVAERFHRVGTVSRERRLAIESAQRGASERRRDLEIEAQHLRDDVAEAAGQERSAQADAERAEITLRALEDEEQSLADQDHLPVEGVVAALRGDLRALEATEDRDRREAEALEGRARITTARLEEEAEEAARLADEIQSVDAEVAAAQDHFEGAKEDRAAAQRLAEAAERSWREASLALAGARARAAALTSVSGEGAATDVPGTVGRLADLLAVSPEFQNAVAAAMGPWVDAIVADDVPAAIRSIKTESAADTPVVAAATAANPAAAATAEVSGAEPLITKLGNDDALARRLLGDVVIVEGWATAWSVVQRHPTIRAVTPEGDLVTATGIRPAPVNSDRLAEEAAAAVAAAESAVAAQEPPLKAARQRMEQAAAAFDAARESLEVLETRLAGATEASSLIQRSRAEGEAEAGRLQERGRALADAASQRAERMAELKERLSAFEDEESAAWEGLEERRKEVASRRASAGNARDEAASRSAAATERRRITERRLTEVDAQLTHWDADEVAGDPGPLLAIEEQAKHAQSIVKGHVAALRARQRQLRHSVGHADDQVAESYKRRSELEQAIASARDAAASLDIELAEARTRLEAAAEGLRRDADAGEEEALATASPDLADGADPADRLEALESELRRMGPINPLAAGEYRDLAEHADFLEAQLSDLEESRSELRKVIAALDKRIGSDFRQAFDEVSGYFEENFERLFPGGKGRLRLTDPDSPLETGVEVVAQPLGKRVSRLSLLSGGERSLAAIAFLFAVFRARPSPFYILDEVEAALDDANLRRFLRLVDLLGESSQLVIVTHQQQTMEAGDMLYGVTMEPGESSKVIAKRLAAVRV